MLIGLRFEIRHRPSYSILLVELGAGETITAEAGALTFMSPNVEADTRTRQKGLVRSLATSVFGGQSFFVTDFTAVGGPGEVALAAAPLGDVVELEVGPDQSYVFQRAGYLASTPGVELDVRWEGFTRGLFGQGLFMVRAEGSGSLFLNTFGAVEARKLAPGERLVVDNFHLVAFSDSCDYEVRRFSGWKETLSSGEGLVTEVEGPGEVYIQTKNLREFVEWLWTILGPKVSSRRAR